MAVYKLGAVEARFAELIWENEPLPSNLEGKVIEEAKKLGNGGAEDEE